MQGFMEGEQRNLVSLRSVDCFGSFINICLRKFGTSHLWFSILDYLIFEMKVAKIVDSWKYFIESRNANNMFIFFYKHFREV